MLDFANPYLLLILLAVPLLWGLYKLAQISRRRKLKRLGNPKLLTELMPDASRYKPGIKITLQLLALAAIVVILARPRYGEREDSKNVVGIECVICFDLSNSMLAQSTDDPHSVSRLKRAKLLLEKLTDKLDNDRVGLVVYANEALVKMPLTNDFYSAKLTLNDLEPSMIKAQGTNIAAALDKAKSTFSQNKDVHRAIILITDAEDHEGRALEAAKEAAKQGIQIDVVGVGTSRGARIPLDKSAGQYMRDNNGDEVITKVDENAAAEIAKVGNGIYVNGADRDALDKLSTQLDKLSKSELRTITYKISAEQFPLFAWIALLLLLTDIFVLPRKSPWLKDINFFSNKGSKPLSLKKDKAAANATTAKKEKDNANQNK